MTEPDKSFLWGEISNVDSVPQITRSMIELQTPKPYQLPPTNDPQPRANSPQSSSISISPCPHVLHCIKLQVHIRKLEAMINTIESAGSDWGSYGSIDNLYAENLQIPEFNEKVTPFQRSPSTILNQQNLHNLLKKACAQMAAKTGFTETNASCLDVLTDITSSFIDGFGKTLRSILDDEALTSNTSFYDAMDTACHETSGMNSQELLKAWEKDVIKKRELLECKADNLTKKLNQVKGARRNVQPTTFKVKKEKSDGFSGTYGKWTPVMMPGGISQNQPTQIIYGAESSIVKSEMNY